MYRLNEEKMFFDIADGQAVVINFVSGMYYGTTALGSVILERLLKGCAPAEIAGAVKALPDCPPMRCALAAIWNGTRTRSAD